MKNTMSKLFIVADIQKIRNIQHIDKGNNINILTHTRKHNKTKIVHNK